MTNTTSSPDSSQQERTLGDFRLGAELARGGMGIVYSATQISLGRKVAVKILPTQLTLDSVALERFKREALITANLRHPAIIEIHAIGEADRVHFIAMELIEGASLGALIDRMRAESVDPISTQADSGVAAEATTARRLSTRSPTSGLAHKSHVAWAVGLIADVADALHHAHEAGVVHRDVKPSNIIVREGTREPVLLDFGLARREGMAGVTVTGDFAGTPNYTAPEQALGRWERVGPRSDVFSLGATLYELLTLVSPFDGENIPLILQRITSKEPVHPQKINPALPNDLVTVVLKSLEKEPEQRYTTAAEFAADLRAFLAYRPIHARRASVTARGLRWIRREPLKATLVVALAAGIPLLMGLGWQLRSQGAELAAAEDELVGIRMAEQLENGFIALGDRGRLASAESAFRTALEHDPTSLEAIAGLAHVWLSAGRTEQALDFLAQQRAKLGTTALARIEAETLSALGRESEASTLLEELAPPSSALELFLEGFRLVRAAQFDVQRVGGPSSAPRSNASAFRAIDLLSRAIIRSKNQRALFHYALATAVWAGRDEPRAREVADTLLEFWPERDASWHYAGLALEVVDTQAALDAYAQALSLTPDFLPSMSRRAAYLGELGQLSESADAYRKVLERAPDYAPAHANLAACLQLLGDNDNAVSYAMRALELDDRQPEVFDTLGSALQALGRLDEAVNALARGVELQPDSPHLNNDLGWVQAQRNELDQAREALGRAVTLDPDFALAHFNLALVHQQAGDLEKATTSFERACELDPSWAEAWANLSSVFTALSQWEDAIAAGRSAVEAAPEHALLHLNLALTLCRAGHFDESIPLYERAIELDGSLHEPRLWMADAFAAMGRVHEQARALEDQVQAFPDDASSWNRLAWLRVDPEGDPDVHDAERGLAAAKRAAELSDRLTPSILDTLGWAHFATGDMEAALTTLQEAVALLDNAEIERAEAGAIRGSLKRLEGLESSE